MQKRVHPPNNSPLWKNIFNELVERIIIEKGCSSSLWMYAMHTGSNSVTKSEISL